MNRKTKNLLTKMLVLSAVLAFVVGACDFKPSTAFDGFDGETSSGIIDEQGATLRGTVQGGQSNVRAARAQRAFTAASQAGALTTVYVFDPSDPAFDPFVPERVKLNNAIGSAPIVDYSFTLRGLPEAFILVFVDAGGDIVGYPMPFEGVKPNQEIDIVVERDGDDVNLVEESRTGIDHDELEFNGPAYHVMFESNPMNGTLEVNDYVVESRAGQTSIRKGNVSYTLEYIRDNEGIQVKVRGVSGEFIAGKQHVFAYEIKLQDDEDDDPVSGTATVCHVPPGNPENAKTLEIPASDLAGHLGHGDSLGPCP